MDLMCHGRGAYAGKSIILSGCHVPSLQLLNGFGNYAHRQEGATPPPSPSPINVSQWKGIDFSLLSESNGGLLYCEGISLKRH